MESSSCVKFLNKISYSWILGNAVASRASVRMSSWVVRLGITSDRFGLYSQSVCGGIGQNQLSFVTDVNAAL